MLTLSIILAVATFATAALSAVVGMGGGVTLMAVMAVLLPEALVVPLHGVVQLTSNGTRAVLMREFIHRRILAFYLLPAVIGVVVGARWYMGTDLDWFRPAVGIFILFYLATLFWRPRLGRLPLPIFAPLGFVVGSLAALIGATGPLIAPFFLRDDLAKEQVVATKAALQICTHAMKLPAFLFLGFDFVAHLPLLVPMLVAAVAGTYVGRQWLSRLSPVWFTRLFVTVLIVIALRLIVLG